MLIGPYSPCPGGTGKKVRFCCPRLLGELQKIQRMFDGEQFQACLRHVEHLEKTNPDQACLLSIKTLLLRILEKSEEARDTAARFLQKHPGNPIALAESAILAAIEEDGHQAMGLILQALRAAPELNPRVYQAMDAIGQILAADGHFMAARALATLQVNLHRDDRHPVGFLLQLNASPSVPLVVKQSGVRLTPPPDDVPWKEEFDGALSLASQIRWAEAEQCFTRLAERVDGEPLLWRNVATLRAWLADTPRCIEALRKLAALDVPLEDAVEAEALALFLCEDPLGDGVEVSSLRYQVADAERLEDALLSAPRVAGLPPDAASIITDEVPPPKSVFVLFDRVSPQPGRETTHEDLARVVCQALLFGKQTDRDARLEVVGVPASELDETKALIARLGGDALEGEAEQEVMGHDSATRQLLIRNWRLPAQMPPDDFRRMMGQYVEHVLLQVWPQSPLGLLGGKCPQEVAGEESHRVRLLAAIMILGHWLGEAGARFDLNRLRSQLGLPTLGPIDPQQTPLEDLPLVRWSRVEVDKLSDEVLARGYRRAMTHRAEEALSNLAPAVADRSSLAGRPERRLALQMMVETSEDLDQALRYLQAGRREPNQPDGACAHWDLLELSLRLRRGESDEAGQLLEHLQSRHINEPGVARALTELLVSLGVLHPDGTPAFAQEEGPPEQPSLVLPGQGGAKPGELWTPDSQKPAGEKPKIWTPGMD
jgi:tetratricopeptide (TPR) repeat protein